MSILRSCLFTLALSAGSAWARVPQPTVTCFGYGENLKSSELIQVARGSQSELNLRDGFPLVLNFKDVVAFRIKFEAGVFVSYFSVEDEGRQAQTLKQVESFSQLNGINRQIEFNISSGKLKFWRLTAKCQVSEI